LFQRYPALFLIGIGFWMTYCCSYLNLSSTSKRRFDPVYYDPFMFFALVAMEVYGVVSPDVLLSLYLFQGMMVVAKYLRFMTYLV
jgi:hypothetical protein